MQEKQRMLTSEKIVKKEYQKPQLKKYKVLKKLMAGTPVPAQPY